MTPTPLVPEIELNVSHYFNKGRCVGHAQFNGRYCRDVAGPERWCVNCAGFMLLAALRAETQTRHEAERKRDALQVQVDGWDYTYVPKIRADLAAERHRADAFERDLTTERLARQQAERERDEAPSLPLVAAGMMTVLKEECEAQHARAESLQAQLTLSEQARAQAEQAREALRTALETLAMKWRAGAASQTDGYEQCDVFELERCADEMISALLAAPRTDETTP